jgi:hypothetical protein
LELLGIIVLVAAATYGALYLHLNPRGMLSDRKEEIEPLIAARKSHSPHEKASVDWTGIQPLVALSVQRAKKGANHLDKWNQRDLYDDGCLIYPLYREGILLTEIRSSPKSGHSKQVAIVDMTHGGYRINHYASGKIAEIFPNRGAFQFYTMGNQLFWDLGITIPLKGFFPVEWFWRHDPRDNPEAWHHVNTTKDMALIDGRKVLALAPLCLNPFSGLDQIYINRDGLSETWLVRTDSEGLSHLVDKQGGSMHYAVSSDGKWFARRSTILKAFEKGLDGLTVFSVDKDTSWTLPWTDGDLLLCEPTAPYYQEAIRDVKPLGLNRRGVMSISASGRFIHLLRTRTIKVRYSEGEILDTGYPRDIELCMLDLSEGKVSRLSRYLPPVSLQHEFKSAIENWTPKPVKREDVVVLDGVPEWLESAPSPEEQNYNYNYCTYYNRYPNLAWAPDKDKLAVLSDDGNLISFYEYSPEGAKQMAHSIREKLNDDTADPGTGDFIPVGSIDLIGFCIEDFDFWDKDTLLAWGKLGLFKIDLRTLPLRQLNP